MIDVNTLIETVQEESKIFANLLTLLDIVFREKANFFAQDTGTKLTDEPQFHGIVNSVLSEHSSSNSSTNDDK
jgi:hypothetical protein